MTELVIGTSLSLVKILMESGLIVMLVIWDIWLADRTTSECHMTIRLLIEFLSKLISTPKLQLSSSFTWGSIQDIIQASIDQFQISHFVHMNLSYTLPAGCTRACPTPSLPGAHELVLPPPRRVHMSLSYPLPIGCTRACPTSSLGHHSGDEVHL